MAKPINTPTTNDKKETTVMVSIRVPAEMYRQLNAISEKTGVTKSTYFKLGLADLLRKLES